MRFVFIGWSKGDVDATAIRFPTRNARSIPFIGIGDAAIVFFLKFVFSGIGSRIATQPELFNELFAFIFSAQTFEGSFFFVSDDVEYVLIQPLAVRSFQFFAQLFFATLLFFFSQRLGNRFSIGIDRFLLVSGKGIG